MAGHRIPIRSFFDVFNPTFLYQRNANYEQVYLRLYQASETKTMGQMYKQELCIGERLQVMRESIDGVIWS